MASSSRRRLKAPSKTLHTPARCPGARRAFASSVVASMPIVLPRSRPLAPIRFSTQSFRISHIDQSSRLWSDQTATRSLSIPEPLAVENRWLSRQFLVPIRSLRNTPPAAAESHSRSQARSPHLVCIELRTQSLHEVVKAVFVEKAIQSFVEGMAVGAAHCGDPQVFLLSTFLFPHCHGVSLVSLCDPLSSRAARVGPA